MAMNVGPSGGDDDEVVSAINTTPLVDVMLVLLIIFLITIPVVTHTVPMTLPKETNIARQTKPENIEISVNKDGDVFWNAVLVPDSEALFQRMKTIATMTPSTSVNLRAASASGAVTSCQNAPKPSRRDRQTTAPSGTSTRMLR